MANNAPRLLLQVINSPDRRDLKDYLKALWPATRHELANAVHPEDGCPVVILAAQSSDGVTKTHLLMRNRADPAAAFKFLVELEVERGPLKSVYHTLGVFMRICCEHEIPPPDRRLIDLMTAYRDGHPSGKNASSRPDIDSILQATTCLLDADFLKKGSAPQSLRDALDLPDHGRKLKSIFSTASEETCHAWASAHTSSGCPILYDAVRDRYNGNAHALILLAAGADPVELCRYAIDQETKARASLPETQRVLFSMLHYMAKREPAFSPEIVAPIADYYSRHPYAKFDHFALDEVRKQSKTRWRTSCPAADATIR